MAANNDFKHIKPVEITGNFIERIGEEWMLIAAKDDETGKFNMMTASWGTAGFMWNRPVITCVIRPHRYTYEFTEKSDLASFMFFGGKRREALDFCGAESGRDRDKVKETGLTPCFSREGAVYFEEAELVIIGKKCYNDNFKEDNFVERSIPGEYYPAKDYHRVYIYEIIDVLLKTENN